MDFASLDTVKGADEGADFTPRNPATGASLKGDDGKPVVWRVHGSDGTRARQALDELRNWKLANPSLVKNTAQAQREENNRLLAACVSGWSANWSIDGEKPPCTPENVAKALERFPWLRDQIDSFAAERAHFLPSSSRT